MSSRTPNILVVEDDSGVRWSIVEALLEEGYTVWEANNGRQGLEILARMPRPPNLVLLDMHMPGMDGAAFLQKLRATAGFEEVPVVVVSAEMDQHLGVQGWMTKPVDRDALLDTVEAHCAPWGGVGASGQRMQTEFSDLARGQFDRLPSDRKYCVQEALVRIAEEGRAPGGRISLTINGLDVQARVSDDGLWLVVEAIDAPLELSAAARQRARRAS